MIFMHLIHDPEETSLSTPFFKKHANFVIQLRSTDSLHPIKAMQKHLQTRGLIRITTP
jgi:hypothetical protein|tara:strand:- start:180 stop:353 length:174 start_codon:yes stop_codon:yes gene_type:complete